MAAIYVWLGNKKTLLTTTLYPTEVNDAITFDVSIDAGAMDLLPVSGPTIMSMGMLGGTLVQERWFVSDGPYDSGPTIMSMGMLDGTLVNKLVIADTPDESLQLYARIDTCSMDLV